MENEPKNNDQDVPIVSDLRGLLDLFGFTPDTNVVKRIRFIKESLRYQILGESLWYKTPTDGDSESLLLRQLCYQILEKADCDRLRISPRYDAPRETLGLTYEARDVDNWGSSFVGKIGYLPNQPLRIVRSTSPSKEFWPFITERFLFDVEAKRWTGIKTTLDFVKTRKNRPWGDSQITDERPIKITPVILQGLAEYIRK